MSRPDWMAAAQAFEAGDLAELGRLATKTEADVPSRRNNGQRAPLRGYAEWRPQARARETLSHVEEVFDRYADHLPLTARQIYYSLVAAGHLDKTEAGYDHLCDVLIRARRARLIAFADIRDDGMSVIAPDFYYGVEDFHEETGRRARRFRRDREEGQPQRIELWCEAAGMLGQLERVARDFSIPVYSGGGFSSLSAVRLVADRALSAGRPTLLLHVGDFDPSGESIFTSLSEDAAAFVREDRTVHTIYLDAQRVALTAQQVADYELPTAPPKATDGRSRGWTGGGTCQLEALPPDDLAEIVRTAIEEHFVLDTYNQTLALERNDRAELLGLPSGETGR